LTSGVT